MPTPGLIIFDLDGTLVDSLPGIRTGLNRALEDLGRSPRDRGWVRDHVGFGARYLISSAAGDDLDPDALMTAFRHRYGEVLIEATRPFPGVDEALVGLAREHDLAIASNKPLEWTDALVDHLGWRDLTREVVGPETANAKKPDPAMIEAVLTRTGRSAVESLLVGDMPVDAETGANAGIPVVGVATGSYPEGALRSAGCVDVITGVPALAGWLATRGRLFV
jgi:phosphoglycolate phosphatase